MVNYRLISLALTQSDIGRRRWEALADDLRETITVLFTAKKR